MQFWYKYHLVLIGPKAIDEVANACVNAFVKSPNQLEVKTYLITQILHRLTYEHVDTILTSMENRLSEIEHDGSNSYLLCNLNPIKTACHMLHLLH